MSVVGKINGTIGFGDLHWQAVIGLPAGGNDPFPKRIFSLVRKTTFTTKNRLSSLRKLFDVTGNKGFTETGLAVRRTLGLITHDEA